MTSRAGPTILERILDGREPLLDLMSEYRAAIEQEVRDDIRARIGDPFDWNPGYCPWCDKTHAEGHASDCLFAAISSSSATETQGLTHREQLAYKAGELAGREAERLGVSATETQDGERPGLRAMGKELIDLLQADLDVTSHTLVAARDFVDAALAAPTPDDRDREHESHDLGPDCPDPIEHVGPQSDDQVAAAVRTVRTALDDRDREVERIDVERLYEAIRRVRDKGHSDLRSGMTTPGLGHGYEVTLAGAIAEEYDRGA